VSMLPLFLLCALGVLDPQVPVQSIEGADEPVPLGEMAELYVAPPSPIPPDWVSSSVLWRVFDLSTGKEVKVRAFKEAGKDGVFFGVGVKKRKLKAFAAVSHLFASKDGDKVKEVAVRSLFLSADIQVGEEDPDPPVPPVPPGPVLSELAKAFSDALKADPETNKAEMAGLWAQFYRSASTAASDSKLATWGDLFNATAVVAKSTGLAKKTPGLQRAFAAHLKTVLPWEKASGTAMNPANRKTAAEAFNRVAAALEEVK